MLVRYCNYHNYWYPLRPKLRKGGSSDFLGSIQSESEQKQRNEDHDTDDRHDAKEV